jgi:hypothetical protein
MKYPKTIRSLLVLTASLIVLGLPLAGKWVRRHPDPRCDLDGLKIEPLYQVRVVDGAGAAYRFCCVRCARLWLLHRAIEPKTVYVTDEASGEEMDSRSAFFVQSAVFTNPITRNRIHVFHHRSDAEEHARSFGGWTLTDAELGLPRFPAPGGRNE